MFEKRDNAVVFSYDREDLLREACLISSYKSRTAKDKDGEYAGEEFVMTEDEGEAFNVFTARVAAELHEAFLKLTYGVEQAFTTDDGSVTIKLRDNGGYNENVLAGVDAAVKEALLNGVLREWYAVCGSDSFREYMERYAISLRMLRDKAFELRKRAL